MGSSSSTTTQQSQSSPWAPAMPAVNGLFGQLQGLIPNVGVTSPEQGAINQLTANGQAGNPYASSIGGVANSLLNGGGATNEAGRVNQNYQNYYAATNPLASNTNYDPMQTPGIGDQLQALKDSITTGVNGQFAAAGRDMSGYNQKALGQGLTAGLAPVITAQYNQNVQNQQGAANNLYNAGNTTTSALTGMNTQANANKVAGIGAAGEANTAQNWGPQQVITAQELAKSIPSSNLGLLAQIGIPLAALGTNSSGTSNSQNTPSLLQDITGIGGLFSSGAGGTSAAAGMGQAAAGGASGIMGMLGLLSDRRAKEDIEQVGTLFDGTPVYRYRYIGLPTVHIGLMADDVEKDKPEAVMEIGGLKRVDYKIATDQAVAMGAR
ncbi:MULTISPECIES: tail fiber domain-containing protein [unclassified Bradyrhizobium]|uniref:tail fiber domain-containing protein n=2 Tax=Bradyrhizobium TaxID=374 RepID=UPI0028E7B472|nr:MULTISPECIES: tail fiber domain-containing protein [unclassified Bradyrhizobium]